MLQRLRETEPALSDLFLTVGLGEVGDTADVISYLASSLSFVFNRNINHSTNSRLARQLEPHAHIHRPPCRSSF
jgi:hypothetical protein